MQENNHVLKTLVCALLHLEESRVHEVTILNPIELGKHINEKDFFLDINVLLDYTLFPDAPEFYATYRLMNVKSHKIYSDKLRISVLELNQIELATEEDQTYRIDYWARLFKATTWKELKALAEQNPIFTEAARTAVVLSEDEKIRLQCEAREDYYRRVGWKDKLIEELTSEKQQWASEKQELASEIQRLRQLLQSAGIPDSQNDE